MILDTTNSDHRRVEEAIDRFVRESNMIEGIDLTTSRHYAAHYEFLDRPITIDSIIELVHHLQPDAMFRDQPQIPRVRVGRHIAPPSGPDIRANLASILVVHNPWEQHCLYECLHPFTDGNGRSGQAIWLHRHHHNPALDSWAVRRGFLHSFYYHTLSNFRSEPDHGE